MTSVAGKAASRDLVSYQRYCHHRIKTTYTLAIPTIWVLLSCVKISTQPQSTLNPIKNAVFEEGEEVR